MKSFAAVALAGLAFLAGGATLAQTPSLTLDEALAQALSASPALAASRLGRAEAQARRDIARLRPNPDLNVERTNDLPHDAASVSIPIERGGKRGRRIALAEAQARSGEAEIARRTAETRNQVRRAYFSLAAAQRRAAETAELQRLAESARDTASARFESGDVPRLDVLQAELSAVQAASETDRERGLLAGARAGLNALLGRPLDGSLTASTGLDAGMVPPVDEAVRLALASSAELSVLDLGIAEQQAQVELARAEAVRDVTAEAGVLHDALPEFDWGWRAALTFTLPVFTRGREQVRLEEATLARLRAEREAAAARLRGEVAAAAATAEAQRQALLRYRDEILPRAAEVERLAEDSYRSGQTDLTALLQSLQSVHDLRLQAVQAGIDYQAALADLERAMGAPLP
ncbi:MAG TPA: TolC family protein [Thermoanaerobaculia bacterium]|jgi:cobalt-zinc-cadmium efflux system outer membrane protein|nr:TolC family protein [Thermoanaerobaculia bacterium]